MGCRIYEADKHGRITIYLSLNSSAKKGHGMLKWLRKKLVVTISGIRKNDTGRAQV